MSRFQLYTSSLASAVPGCTRLSSPTSASSSGSRRRFQSHYSSSLLPQPSDSMTFSHQHTTTENTRKAAAPPRSLPFFSVVPRGVLLELEELQSEVSRLRMPNISPSAYEQPKTPKKSQNTKFKNTITIPPVASPSSSWVDIAFIDDSIPSSPSPSLSHLSACSYRSPSPSPSEDLSEDPSGIKDPFASNLHFLRMDESCDCSKCDAACNDSDVSDSMTLYSGVSVSLVEDDSSLTPILEPCIAFDFDDFATNPTNISGAAVVDDADLSWVVPCVEGRRRWVSPAVALGAAVVAAVAAWTFWVLYMGLAFPLA